MFTMPHQSQKLVAKLGKPIIPQKRGILGLDIPLDDRCIAQKRSTFGREGHQRCPTIAGIDGPFHVAYLLQIVYQPAHRLLAHAGPAGKIDNSRALDIEMDQQRGVGQRQSRMSSGLQHGHGSCVECAVEAQAEPADVLLSHLAKQLGITSIHAIDTPFD